ncbi:MAG: DUF1565 domain-containing protein [Myxococcales bacterium]
MGTNLVPFVFFTLWVDPVNGSDTADGSMATPIKTIKHALQQIAPGDLADIHLKDGTYNAASGETFPITLPAGVSLQGSTSSVIAGSGAYAGNATAVVAEGGNTITSVTFDVGAPSNTYGVISTSGVSISSSTFRNGFGGVFASSGDVTISLTTFDTTGVGVYRCGAGSIVNSTFVAMSTPILLTDGSCTLQDNQIGGSGGVGVEMQSTGVHSLVHNTFARGAGYTNGAVHMSGAVQVVMRNNDIQAVAQVAVFSEDMTYLDLGTPSDPGQNKLGRVDAVGIDHRSSATIPAFGNTWAHEPPAANVDIKQFPGAGQVAVAAGDFCAI